MWIKLCANTTLSDALLVAEADADAAGFVFAPSKRQVTAEQVREIASGLPPELERVGVFGHLSAGDIAEAAIHARLTAVQLHAGFNPVLSAHLAELLGPAVTLIETLHWNLDTAGAEQEVAAGLQPFRHGSAPRVLLDAKAGKTSGGLGLSFDWTAAARALTPRHGVRLILAGGLDPENVAQAIQLVQPWGVDVASGVEFAPGKKDPRKVRQFIENARGA